MAAGEDVSAARKAGRRYAREHMDAADIPRDVCREVFELFRAAQPDGAAAGGVSLYDVHRSMEDNGVGWGSRVREGLHGVLEDGADVLEWARGDGARNLFAGQRADELNRVQRAANRAASNRWVRGNATVAQLSEDFLRGASFVSGVRRYGLDDDGRAASLLTKGLHFDYDDLSDFEKRWLRGFALPC